ncbi:MAG: hypothetical protein HZA54_10880, partial [Planctomycetes bacterium]|nr:hypothetical protein [Planctomycetota bacterium]
MSETACRASSPAASTLSAGAFLLLLLVPMLWFVPSELWYLDEATFLCQATDVLERGEHPHRDYF